MPLSFEASRGQADSQVKFLSRGSGSTLFLTSDEAALALRSQKSEARRASFVTCPQSFAKDKGQRTRDKGPGTNDVLQMTLVGATRDRAG